MNNCLTSLPADTTSFFITFFVTHVGENWYLQFHTLLALYYTQQRQIKLTKRCGDGTAHKTVCSKVLKQLCEKCDLKEAAEENKKNIE